MAALRWLATRVWFWPVLLTAALGLWRIGRPELWRDELRSWSAVSRPFGDLLHLLGNTDAAVALYYLLLYPWIRLFGDSAVSMRLPSLIAMAGAAACVGLIGQRLYSKRVGVVAGLLFAVIPAVTRFSQEVRPYAITMLLVCVSTLLLLRTLERPTRWRWFGYALSIAGVGLAQVVALPVLAAHAVGVLLWPRLARSGSQTQRGPRSRIQPASGARARTGTAVSRPLRVWLVWAAVGLVMAAPVLLLSMSQYGHQVGSLPDATLGELTLLPARLFSSAAVAGVIIALCLLAFARKVVPALFLAAWAVLPIGIVWVVSNLGQSYWMTRYLLPTLPAFALLAGAAVTVVANLRVAALVLVAVMALGYHDHQGVRSVGSHDAWNYPESYHEPLLYSRAAELIATNQQPGDGIMYVARDDYWLLDIGLAYHLRGQPQPADVMVRETALQRGDFWVAECDQPAECVGDAPRIWLVAASVAYGTGIATLDPETRRFLETRYDVAERFAVSGISVVLWERDLN